MRGCEYCYARSIVKRFGATGPEADIPRFPEYELCDIRQDGAIIKNMRGRAVCSKSLLPGDLTIIDGKKNPYPYGFNPTLRRDRLNEYKNKKGRTIFVCSMADLFGWWVPYEWIQLVFNACLDAPQHTYMFLTKNPSRYYELESRGLLPRRDNMWYGTTITGAEGYEPFGSEDYMTFVSIEPLLCPIDDVSAVAFNFLTNWIILGAETGNRNGKVAPRPEWIKRICEIADSFGTPIFMKDSLVPTIGEDNMRREFPWGIVV